MLCEKTGLKIPIKAQEFGMNENNSFLIKTQVWGGGGHRRRITYRRQTKISASLKLP